MPSIPNTISSSSAPLPGLLPLAPLLRRFFFKPPKTSMSKSHNPLHFSSPKSLSDWLKPRLPASSLSTWGLSPGTKNLHNLWLEVSQGETSLADSTPPIRTVHVATIRIFPPADPAKTLIETHQELSDGSVRARERPLSEKMKPGEGIEEAVKRALKEELGRVLGRDQSGTIVPGSYRMRVEERVSVSYPGLQACYVLHSVDAVVGGLPEGAFWTDEEGEERDSERDCEGVDVAERAVFVRRHFWKWVAVDDSLA